MDNKVNWTIENYAVYNEALREADNKFQEERDRRYREIEQVKKEAEDKALYLAREIQIYKDEKANELREQINNERLLYVRKGDLGKVEEKIVTAIDSIEKKYDLILKPLTDFAASREGREKGVDKTLYYVFTIIGIILGIIGSYLVIKF